MPEPANCHEYHRKERSRSIFVNRLIFYSRESCRCLKYAFGPFYRLQIFVNVASRNLLFVFNYTDMSLGSDESHHYLQMELLLFLFKVLQTMILRAFVQILNAIVFWLKSHHISLNTQTTQHRTIGEVTAIWNARVACN